MLAKTLWVLATGPESAVPGEQRIDVPALTISYYVRHPHARQLDLLVERATRHIPRERPSMTEFAAELKAWLTPLPATGRLEDLSIMAPMLMASNEPAVRADQALEALRAQISSAIATFHRLLSPIAEDLQRKRADAEDLDFR
ncbi:MAG: hypothetical protein M9927_10380 [Anaerolineae bacterium]|nr:hypothetical protein [Anaerolineae bacterium]